MNNLLELSDLESYDKATQGKAIMVFSTTWCPDCHFLKPDLTAQQIQVLF